MSDQQTSTPGATLKLSEATIQALRDTWRAAGGVTYSAPKGQMAAMAEPKLFAFLASVMLEADRSVFERGAPAVSDLSAHVDRVETVLLDLVKAICPGLEHHDLLADAAIARAAMAGAEPAAYFAIDDEPASDGSARYLHIGAEHSGDEDVFPLYRRAPTVAELAAHIDRHQVAGGTMASADIAPSADNAATKTTPAAKKASTK